MTLRVAQAALHQTLKDRKDVETPAARPKVAVDVILFALVRHRLKCYLIRLRTGALAGRWAFPGRLVRVGEQLDAAARGELQTAAGLPEPYLEQLYTFGDPTRDPGDHVVSVSYLALTADPASRRGASEKYAQGEWFDPGDLPQLAYDHAAMAGYAVKRLRAKLEYTDLARHLLPPAFTFAQLEELYAAVLARELDRRNFRRRILATDLIERLARQRRGAHRPAGLYRFAGARTGTS